MAILSTDSCQNLTNLEVLVIAVGQKMLEEKKRLLQLRKGTDHMIKKSHISL